MCSSRGGSGSTLPTLPHLGAVPTSEGGWTQAMDRFAVLAHGEVACDARSIQVRPIGTLMCRLIHVRCMSATPAARWPLITPRAAGLTSHSLSPFPLYRCSHLCRHQPRRLQHGGCSRLRLQMAWPRLRRLASLMLALGLAAFATSLAACSMVAAAASACKWLSSAFVASAPSMLALVLAAVTISLAICSMVAAAASAC